jgi:hypothetical protein
MVKIGPFLLQLNPVVEHLDMFTHVEGCSFCKKLYAHYELPNG